MRSFLTCPHCQALLVVPPGITQRFFRCTGCGQDFTAPAPEEVLDAILVEDAEEVLDVLPADEEIPPSRAPGCLFQVLALTPLGIAALGIPFCRFGTGVLGGAAWAVLALGLCLACVAVVWRRQWHPIARALISLVLTGGGYLLLLAALGVSFWQWMHTIDPAGWRDFSPPGGHFHISVPGTPVAQPVAAPNLPPGFQIYALDLHRQDVAFSIGYGDVPLNEWNGQPLQLRFDNALAGMQANMPGSQVVAQTRISVDHNPGREYHLLVPGKGMLFARVYFVRNRLFVLVIAGSRLKADSEDVSRFLDSFRPDPVDEKVAPPLRPEQQPPDIQEEDIFPGRTILGREDKEVTQLVVSRDGSTVAVGCEDCTIGLWDLTGIKRQGTLRIGEGFHQPAFSFLHLALSPDGKTLAVGTLSGVLKLFDARNQNELAELLPGGQQTAGIECIAFSPGGRLLATGHWETLQAPSEVRLWDVPGRKLVRPFRSQKGRVTALAWSPDGRFLVVGDAGGIIRWLDPSAGGEIKRYEIRKDGQVVETTVTSLAFTADGSTLAASYHDHTTRLWDVRTGQNRVALQRPGGVVALDITPNGRFLLTGTYNGELRVSETATGKGRWEEPGLDLNQTAPARALAFTPDGKRLIISRQKRIELWDLEKLIRATPDELAEPKARPPAVEPEVTPAGPPPRIEAHSSPDANARHGVFALGLSADDRTLVTAGWDRRVRFWDLASGAKRAEATIDADPVGFAVSHDGRTAAVATVSAIHLYDVSTAGLLGTLTPDIAAIVEAMMRPDLRDILKRNNRGKLPPSPPGAAPIGALAFAPDSRTLAVSYPADRAGLIEMWDVAARKVLRRFETELGGNRIAFSPDGKTLAIARDNDSTVRLYDVPTGKEMAQLRGIEWGASALAYSGDGKYVAAAGGGETVLLWDAIMGQERKRFRDHKHRIVTLAISPDGKTLASGDFEETVRVYDLASAQPIGRFAVRVSSLCFSHDGKTLLVGSSDGWVDRFSVANLPRLAAPAEPIVENKQPARLLAFGKDLQRLRDVEPFLAAAVDPQAGRALLLGRDRFLRVYSYPDFKPQRAYWLGATAYRAVLDRQHGALYAAVCNVAELRGDRGGNVGGPADLHVFDVKKILAGDDETSRVLRPTAVIPLRAEMKHLVVTPDGRWVYYLDTSNWMGARLGRINTSTRKPEQTTVSNATGSFSLSRDGKSLYVGRIRRDANVTPQHMKGEIQVFDPATMQPRTSIDVPSQPKEIAVEDELLFFGGEGPLGVLNMRPARPDLLGHWDGPWFGGQLLVGIAPRRVYIVPRSIPTTIRAFEFPENAPPKDRPQDVDSVTDGNGDGSFVGQFLTTPDGKFLLCPTGAVLRLAVPGVNRPLPPAPEEARPPAADLKGLPWRERKPLVLPKRPHLSALAISPDGKTFAVGTASGWVCLCERESGQVQKQNYYDLGGIAYLAYAPSGKTLFATTFDRSAQLRVAANVGAYRYFQDLGGLGRDAVAFTSNSAQVAAAGGAQGKEVVIWNVEAGGGRAAKTLGGSPDPLTAVALSPDGKWLAAGTTAGAVRQVDPANPRDNRAMGGHTAEVRCVAYSPAGGMLASAGVDGMVKVWDPATGRELRTLRGNNNVVLCLAFAPDGKTLVSGDADGTLRIWDPATGEVRGVVAPHRRGAMVYALAFTRDGKALAAACGDEVRLWHSPD
jgi:WD40 repeat protein